MKLALKLMLAAVMMTMPFALRAETKTQSDYEKIQIMLEYNQRMVKLTENYLRDRSKIPGDYQDVADKEYLRKSKLEKPLTEIRPSHVSMPSSQAAEVTPEPMKSAPAKTVAPKSPTTLKK